MNRRTLNQADIIDLCWYFGPGSTVFERSPCHTILETAKKFDTSDAKLRQRMDYNAELREAASFGVTREEAYFELGWGPEPTAHITAETTEPAGVNVDERDLIRMARTSRGLRRLSSFRTDGYSVMALVYGPGSETWTAHGFPLGGLYQLTTHGRAVTAAALQGLAVDSAGAISLPDALHRDMLAAVVDGDGARVAMYGAADGAAERLFGDVARAWNDLHRGEHGQ